MSDWWSKKLAGEKPTTSRTNLPPVQAPIGFPQAQQPQQPQDVVSNPAVLPEDATFSDHLKAGLTKGGQATRTETASCPQCGGRYVFSRGTGATGLRPAPRCYECGWNGIYSQGDQATWASS